MTCEKPLGPWLATSAWRIYRSTICADAVIHPSREPGTSTLEKESIRKTRPSVSMLSSEGTRSARNWSTLAGGGGTGASLPA
ncbi:hypothetical protein VDGD_21463 [Verticillium dahliae]|nr:hypothetical protein VDGD_21463 [Verticillium dahliae]